MMKQVTWTRLLMMGAMILLLAGCSFSYSSGKSSDSSKSSSQSSSPSKDSESEFSLYQNDIKEYTQSVAHSERSSENFLRDVGRIAERHGITDWESERTTFTAIGSGLKAAGISRKSAESLTFMKEMSARNQGMMAYVNEGYNS